MCISTFFLHSSNARGKKFIKTQSQLGKGLRYHLNKSGVLISCRLALESYCHFSRNASLTHAPFSRESFFLNSNRSIYSLMMHTRRSNAPSDDPWWSAENRSVVKRPDWKVKITDECLWIDSTIRIFFLKIMMSASFSQAIHRLSQLYISSWWQSNALPKGSLGFEAKSCEFQKL